MLDKTKIGNRIGTRKSGSRIGTRKSGNRIGTRILTLALSLVLVLGTMVMIPNDSAKANIANSHKLTVNFKNLDVDGNEISGPNKGGNAQVVYTPPGENPRYYTFPASKEFEFIGGSDVKISPNEADDGYKFVEITFDDGTGWEPNEYGGYSTTSFQKDTTATVIFQKQKNEIRLKYEAPKCGTVVENKFEKMYADDPFPRFLGQTPKPNVKYETPGCSEPEDVFDYLAARLIKSINEEYFENKNIFSGKLTGNTKCYIYIPIAIDEEDFDIRDKEPIGKKFNGTVYVNNKPAELVEYLNDFNGILFVCAKAEIKHDWDTGRVTKEATCTEKGVKEFVCKGCNEKKTEDIAALGHDWDNGKITKKPTATKKGVKTFTCSRCKATRTESIPATGKKKSKVVVPTILKMTAKGKKAFNFSWNKAAGASGYEIYLSRCNTKKKSYTPKKVKTIKGNKKFSATIKGLKAKTPYKAYIRPYKMKKGKKTYLKKGPTMHALTSGSSRFYTNAKQIEMLKTSAKIKAGKSVKIKATVEKIKSGKKLMNSKHSPKLRYISTNKSVATVSKSGKVRAKAKGSCKIYIFTVNGVSKTFKVTVK